MTDTPGVYRYLELVKGQQKAITNMSAGERAAQLGYSSLDDTFLPVLDALGQVRMAVGRQPDNTYAVTYANGDPPPTPTAPVVAPRQGAALVGWDGTFANGAEKPGDFARIDIHISETPDFVPDGSTVVGYLLGEAATLVPLDNVTHYVRLVAVTLSDVVSPPTIDESVLPEPAGVLAANSVAAEHIASDILLTHHRFIAGDPDGSRLEFNGYAGLELFNRDGKRTIHLDPNTGTGTFTGEIRTRMENNGLRMVWNPEFGGRYSERVGIQFFANTSGRYFDRPMMITSQEYPYEPGTMGPSVDIIGPDQAEGQRFQMQMNYSMSMYILYPYGQQYQRRMMAEFRESVLNYRNGVSVQDPGYSWGAWFGNLILHNPQWAGTSNSSFIGYLRYFDGGAWDRCGVTVDCSSGHVNSYGSLAHFYNYNQTGYINIGAKNVGATCSISAKENIARPDSMLDTVRNSPVSTFRYVGDEDNAGQIGVMAEDMPEWSLMDMSIPDRDTGEPGPEMSGVSLNNQIGILFAALRELDEEIDELRDAARPRITKPKRKKRSNAT